MNNIKEYLNEVDLGKLFLRLAVSLVFINAGWNKIGNLEQTAVMFSSWGLAGWLAYFVAFVEFLGGWAVLLGFKARYAAGLLALVMLAATFKVHLSFGYSLQKGGYEYTLALMFASLAVLYLDAGTYALDTFCKRQRWFHVFRRD